MRTLLPMTLADFYKILADIEPKIPDMACRVVPSSFNPDDPQLRAVPRPLEASWPSAEAILKAFGVRAVMMRLPLFWQTEPLLHAACRAAGAPIFTNDPENMPLGAAALSNGVDTVVTTAADAAAFAGYLAEKHTPLPPFWIIVHQADAPRWEVPTMLRGVKVAQEVHLFPGVPVLVQCPALVGKNRYHFSDIHSQEPLPLSELELPFVLKDCGTCVCGKAIGERV